MFDKDSPQESHESGDSLLVTFQVPSRLVFIYSPLDSVIAFLQIVKIELIKSSTESILYIFANYTKSKQEKSLYHCFLALIHQNGVSFPFVQIENKWQKLPQFEAHLHTLVTTAFYLRQIVTLFLLFGLTNIISVLSLQFSLFNEQPNSHRGKEQSKYQFGDWIANQLVNCSI